MLHIWPWITLSYSTVNPIARSVAAWRCITIQTVSHTDRGLLEIPIDQAEAVEPIFADPSHSTLQTPRPHRLSSLDILTYVP